MFQWIYQIPKLDKWYPPPKTNSGYPKYMNIYNYINIIFEAGDTFWKTHHVWYLNIKFRGGNYPTPQSSESRKVLEGREEIHAMFLAPGMTQEECANASDNTQKSQTYDDLYIFISKLKSVKFSLSSTNHANHASVVSIAHWLACNCFQSKISFQMITNQRNWTISDPIAHRIHVWDWYVYLPTKFTIKNQLNI